MYHHDLSNDRETNTTFLYRSKVITSPEESLDKTFAVYPNPAREVLNIDTEEHNYQVEFLDGMGRTLIAKDEAKQLHINIFPSGVYYLKIVKGRNVVVKKILH